jgi:hypothetical protein
VTVSWQRFTTREWMVGSFCVGLVILVLSRTLTTIPGVDLRATARWSFILFWLGTTGGALTRLFGARFEGLARRARDLSLAYATAHLVHLAIVARILYKQPLPPAAELLVFGIAVFWTYFLAFLSLTSFSSRMGPALWRVIRIIGVEYISLAFLIDFIKNPFDDGFFKALYYLPFQILAIAGPMLRLAAFIKRSIVKRRSVLA